MLRVEIVDFRFAPRDLKAGLALCPRQETAAKVFGSHFQDLLNLLLHPPYLYNSLSILQTLLFSFQDRPKSKYLVARSKRKVNGLQ